MSCAGLAAPITAATTGENAMPNPSTPNVLDDRRAALLAIPAADVDAPDRPADKLAAQITTLVTFIEKEQDVAEGLQAVGVGPDRLVEARRDAEVLLLAESEWRATSPRWVTSQRRETVLQAEALKVELISALRYNLRDDRLVQGAVSEIAGGEGDDDLRTDLLALGLLVERHIDAFAKDKTFEAAARSAEARQLAHDLGAVLDDTRSDTDRLTARELRDRAFTAARDAYAALRAAGRHAFRRDATVLQAFADGWQVEAKRRSRRARTSGTAATPA
jgi:hypothetical protein